MEKPKKIVVIALGTLICGGTMVLAQSKPLVTMSQSNKTANLEPQLLPGETPEQLAIRETQLWQNLSKIHTLNEAAQDAINAGDFAAAEVNAQQSVSLGIGSGIGQRLLAAALYAQGKDAEALQVYTKMARMRDFSGSWPYALLLLKSGHWSEAVQAYDTALTLGGYTGLLRRYTQFSADVPQPQELKAAILIGWATNPNGGSFHGSYEDKKKQGQMMYEEALSLVPNSAIAHYYYGYGLHQMGRRAEAQVAFQKATAMSSGDVKADIEAESKRFGP